MKDEQLNSMNMPACNHCEGTGENLSLAEEDKVGVAITACQYCGGNGESELNYLNVKQFTKEPVSNYPQLGELSLRIDSLIDDYAGELPLMAVIGILELKKINLLK